MLIILLALLALGFGIVIWLNNRQGAAQEAQGGPDEFCSINHGNQVHLIHAVNYDQRWFRQAYDNYRWELFDPADNRFGHYVKALLTPLLKGGIQAVTPQFFDQLTRGQKMMCCLHLLDACMKEADIHRFLHAHSALQRALLETLRELRQERMADLYALCLRDVQANPNAIYAQSVQNTQPAIDFARYYAASENQAALFRAMCTYIEGNVVQFMK